MVGLSLAKDSPKASPVVRAPEPTSTPSLPLSDRVFDAVNEWRIENNYKPLIKSELLCEIASKRAEEIKETWSHDGVWKYIDKLDYRRFGENLGQGGNTAREFLLMWLGSPS